MKKHAVKLRVHLFVAALNHALSLKHEGHQNRQMQVVIKSKRIKHLNNKVCESHEFEHLNQEEDEEWQEEFLSGSSLDAPDSHSEYFGLVKNPQLVNYFARNLPLLWQLGRSKKQLKREWALCCFQNPCEQPDRDVIENQAAPKHS